MINKVSTTCSTNVLLAICSYCLVGYVSKSVALCTCLRMECIKYYDEIAIFTESFWQYIHCNLLNSFYVHCKSAIIAGIL